MSRASESASSPRPTRREQRPAIATALTGQPVSASSSRPPRGLARRQPAGPGLLAPARRRACLPPAGPPGPLRRCGRALPRRLPASRPWSAGRLHPPATRTRALWARQQARRRRSRWEVWADCDVPALGRCQLEQPLLDRCGRWVRERAAVVEHDGRHRLEPAVHRHDVICRGGILLADPLGHLDAVACELALEPPAESTPRGGVHGQRRCHLPSLPIHKFWYLRYQREIWLWASRRRRRRRPSVA